MIKKLLPLICSALSLHSAELPQVAWTFHAGGAKHDKIRALAMDRHGNTFVTGEFSNTAEFADAKLRATGSLDFVLAKLDANGRLIWVTSAGGEKIDRGYAVAVDAKGNSYVTGHFQSESISFGSTVLTNRGDYDVFVAKFDQNGRAIWVKSAGGKAYDFGHGLAVDPRGGIVVSGMIRGEGDFGGAKTEQKSVGPFVAKYSFNGELQWREQMTGQGSGSGHELCVDGKGNVYLGGFFAGTGALGRHMIKTKGRDLFAAKLNRDCEWDWIMQGGGASDGLVSGMAADKQGNCYLAGMFKATARLGKQTLSSAGDHDFYLSKLGPRGKVIWAVHAGGPSIDYGLGLALDPSGNALLTGETTGEVILADRRLRQIGKRDLYAAKFAPDGKLLWAWQAGGKLNSLSYAAGCGPQGLNVIAGAFSGDITIAGEKIASRGSNDIIVVGLRD